MLAPLKKQFIGVAVAVLAGGLMLAEVSAPAAAESAGVIVNVNKARILRINSPASTVIIGNPGIADVTIQDPKTLVLTGKSFGQTNLIILDAVGNPIADTLIDVVQQDAAPLTMYLGSARTTMMCQPVCQPAIMLGDDPAYTSKVISSSSLVSTAAGR